MGSDYKRLRARKTCEDCGGETRRQSGGGRYLCDACAKKNRELHRQNEIARQRAAKIAGAIAERDALDAEIAASAARGSDPNEIGSELYELIRQRTQMSYRRLKKLGLEDVKYVYNRPS